MPKQCKANKQKHEQPTPQKDPAAQTPGRRRGDAIQDAEVRQEMRLQASPCFVCFSFCVAFCSMRAFLHCELLLKLSHVFVCVCSRPSFCVCLSLIADCVCVAFLSCSVSCLVLSRFVYYYFSFVLCAVCFCPTPPGPRGRSGLDSVCILSLDVCCCAFLNCFSTWARLLELVNHWLLLFCLLHVSFVDGWFSSSAMSGVAFLACPNVGLAAGAEVARRGGIPPLLAKGLGFSCLL